MSKNAFFKTFLKSFEIRYQNLQVVNLLLGIYVQNLLGKCTFIFKQSKSYTSDQKYVSNNFLFHYCLEVYTSVESNILLVVQFFFLLLSQHFSSSQHKLNILQHEFSWSRTSRTTTIMLFYIYILDWILFLDLVFMRYDYKEHNRRKSSLW